MKTTVRKWRSPVKTHGGKSYLARSIIRLMPEHSTYVEPFAGGLSVLLNKPPAVLDVANDADASLMRFWRTFQRSGLSSSTDSPAYPTPNHRSSRPSVCWLKTAPRSPTCLTLTTPWRSSSATG
jgi:D12 class N6 adenine-specific DNA methyltransferase